MEIVNGYVCRNCTDVEHAKKGVDPARPKESANDTDKASARRADTAPAERGPAVTFGGSLRSVEPAPFAQRAESRPPQPYAPGSTFSLTA